MDIWGSIFSLIFAEHTKWIRKKSNCHTYNLLVLVKSKKLQSTEQMRDWIICTCFLKRGIRTLDTSNSVRTLNTLYLYSKDGSIQFTCKVDFCAGIFQRELFYAELVAQFGWLFLQAKFLKFSRTPSELVLVLIGSFHMKFKFMSIPVVYFPGINCFRQTSLTT